MNISPINNNQVNTNFGAIKSVKFARKLKDNPLAQEKLLDAFQMNSSLQHFCKKFDVDLVFDVIEDGYQRYMSRMAVIYRELPDATRTIKDKFMSLFKTVEPIVIMGYDCSLTESVDGLCKRLSSEQDGIFDFTVEKFEKDRAERLSLKQLNEKKALDDANQKTALNAKQKEIDERIKKMLDK